MIGSLPLPILSGAGTFQVPLERDSSTPTAPIIIDAPTRSIPKTTSGSGSTGTDIISQIGGKAKSMLQALAADLAISALSSKSGSGSLVKTPWDFMNSAKPSFSSADGKSGDINQTTTFGDFIVNGNKFSGMNTMLLLAGSAIVGVILIRTFKGKKK